MLLLGILLLTISGLLFIYNRLHLFSDIVLLNVTDRNGTEIASTQVMLYKCGTATKYVHVRQNVFLLIH